MKVVSIDLKKYNLSEDLIRVRFEWKNKICIAGLNIVGQGFHDDDNDDGSLCMIFSFHTLLLFHLGY